jgi:hypothetical protein
MCLSSAHAKATRPHRGAAFILIFSHDFSPSEQD